MRWFCVKRSEEACAAALKAAAEWYELQRSKKGSVNTNVMTSGIAVSGLLRETFPLTAGAVKSDKGSQVKGLSGASIKKVLEKHGETRRFTAEGGRTSRRTLVLATDLAERVSKALLPFEPDAQCREAAAEALETYFVNCVVRDYFNKTRLEVLIDLRKPVAPTRRPRQSVLPSASMMAPAAI